MRVGKLLAVLLLLLLFKDLDRYAEVAVAVVPMVFAACCTAVADVVATRALDDQRSRAHAVATDVAREVRGGLLLRCFGRGGGGGGSGGGMRSL